MIDINIAINENEKHQETPVQYYEKISKIIGVNLFVKHDESIQYYGGGNKARKIKYIIKDMKNKANAIVTAGGLQSNHVRATAIQCAELGWKSIMIIHAEEPKCEYYEGNLKIAKLCGAEIRFVDKKDVSKEMDRAMSDLKGWGYQPFYIWGGGHCVMGTYAYYEAVKEVKSQLSRGIYPNYIVLASGTGTTQAGIIAGCNNAFPNTKVFGISVARKKERGTNIIQEAIKEFYKYFQIEYTNQNIHFDDSFIGDGYESIYPELIGAIKWAARTEGLLLDPTYTGKAFYGLMEYVRIGIIPKGANVLFWHTGGLLNLIANKSI